MPLKIRKNWRKTISLSNLDILVIRKFIRGMKKKFVRFSHEMAILRLLKSVTNRVIFTHIINEFAYLGTRFTSFDPMSTRFSIFDSTLTPFLNFRS